MNFLPEQSKCALLNAISLLLFLLSSAGCSDEPTGGISGTGKTEITISTGIIVGRIDSISELSIDGTVLKSNETNVLINGKPGTLSDLRVGMSVIANVDYVDQKATSIAYQPLLAGPVETVTDDKTSLEILGQTINISVGTFLDEITLEEIFQDNVIEVNGNRDKSGTIIADFVRVPNLEDNYFIVGDIEESPTSPETLVITGSNVDLEPLVSDQNSVAQDLTPGITVRVELDPDASQPNNSSNIVTSAEVVPAVTVDKFETVEINGVVTEVFENGNFEVRKFKFSITGETQFKDRVGNEIAGIAIQENQKLKVKGASVGDDFIIATEIRIRD